MARVDGGGSSSAAAAAAEAARRAAAERAEEARRRAEAARKAAEAARKAAEEAAKKAAEAQKKAADAKKEMEAKKAEIAKHPPDDPKTAQRQQRQMDDAQKKVDAANSAAKKAAADAAVKADAATKADGLARTAMSHANDVAKTEGKPAPYQNTASYQSNFDKSIGRRRDDFAKFSGQPVDAHAAEAALKSDQEYAKLASDPKSAQALQQLGIKDGTSLQSFGQRVAREAQDGGPSRKDDVTLDSARNGVDPKAFAKVIQGAGNTLDGEAQKTLTDKTFATAVAEGKSPRDAGDTTRAAAKLSSDPKIQEGLTKLGLTPAALEKAGKDALPELTKAGQAAVDGKWDQAITHLEAAGKKGGEDLAVSAIQTAASHLDGPAKTILSDPKVIRQAIEAAPGTIEKLAHADFKGAVEGLAGNKGLRDAVIDAAAKDPQVKAGLDKIGLTASDLKEAGDALPDVLKAGEAAVKGDWKGAANALLDGSQKTPDLIAKGLQGIGSHLDGPAKTILTDPNAAMAIAKAGPDVAKAFLNDGAVAGLEKTIGNKGLRDAVIDAAAKDPDIKSKLDKLGLTPADLKQAGDAAPSLLKAGEAAVKGDWKGAVNALADGAKAAPDLIAKAIQGAAGHLPDGIVQNVLGDKNVAAQLAKAGPDAIKAFVNDGIGAGLKAIGGNKALRDSVIDAVAKDPKVKPTLDRLGLTAQDLKDGADALPSVLKAGEAAIKGDVPGALSALREAAQTAPTLAQKAVIGLGDKLPPGLAKNLLTDPNVSREIVTDTKLQDAVGKILKGDVLSGVSDFLHNDAARDAVLDVVSKDPKVGEALKKVGLAPSDLKEAGAAAPHVIDAMQAAGKGDWKTALDEMKAAGQMAPDLTQKVGKAVYDKLPATVKDHLKGLNITESQILQGIGALPHLVDAGEAVAKGDWKGALNALGDAAQAAPDLTQSAIKGLAGKLPASFGLAKSLLTNDDVVKALVTDKSLHDGIGQILDGKVVDGVGTLLHDDQARNAVLDVVGKDPTVTAALQKVGLTPANLKEAGDAAPHLFDAMQSIGKGDWQGALDNMIQAGQAAPDLLKKVGSAIVDKLPQGVRDNIAKLGLTVDDLRQAGAALPHLIDAGKDFANKDFSGALQELGNTLEAAPDLATKAINFAASKLPDSFGMAKTLLSDPSLVKDLVADPSLHDGVKQLLAGNISDGLKEISGDQKLMGDVANVLAKDPAVMKRLAPLGIQNASDIAQLGAAVGDAVQLADDVKGGNWGDAIKDLGTVAKDIPEDVRNKLIDTVADKLHLKPEFKEVLKGMGEAITHPEVTAALGKAFDAFKSGNPVDFIKQLGNVGETISKVAPDLMTGFLDSLSHLPGPVGKFFGDPTLNQELVKSGSTGHFFAAVEKVASGDVAGAVGELGSAFGSLITMGKHFELGPYKVGVGFISHTFGPYELPIGQEGLDAVGRLMKQFVAAMPTKVKNFIEEKVANVVANAGFKSIPVVGPIVGMAEDGVNLYNDFKDHKGGIDIALDAADLVVNGASLFPPFEVAAAPLKAVIGIGKAVNDVAGVVGDVKSFGQEFTGMAA